MFIALIVVSIPLRQAKNKVDIDELKEQDMFQFLLGRLKTQKASNPSKSCLRVSIPLRQAKNIEKFHS